MTIDDNIENIHRLASLQGYEQEGSSYASIHQVFVAHVETLTKKKSKPPQSSSPELVLVDTIRSKGMNTISRAFYAAATGKGTKTNALLHFQDTAHKINAAIVTCGGLCPGLNNVIREVTKTLYNQYHAHQVWGVTGGWHGFWNDDYPPILLTNQSVEHVHHQGGSFLRTSRGGLNVQKTVEFLKQYDISHLYIVGGDGTHRAAYQIHEHCRNLALDVAVVGIPKTIDNDIDYLDRSFGFLTAVEAAQASIRTALIEAKCTVPNGIGVIKLMGREAGFLAAFAALGSGGDVDAVLVPEVPIILEGPQGILPFIHQRVQEKKYAVVVVAEGAGQELLERVQEREKGSGNKKLPPIAEFMRDQIQEYCTHQGLETRMKFVDPSYSVRSVPANAADSLYCTQLAQAAVHGAMMGYTGFSVGLVNNRVVYIPIPQLVASSPRFMNPCGEVWARVLAMTGQPSPSATGTGPTTATSTANESHEPNGATTTGGEPCFPTLPEPNVH